jgi:hypothetical protein
MLASLNCCECTLEFWGLGTPLNANQAPLLHESGPDRYDGAKDLVKSLGINPLREV